MATPLIPRCVVCLAMLLAGPASAQLDLTPPPPAPIGFASPDRSESTLPAGGYDRNGLDARRNASGFDVSGSVSTGIGYSDGVGSSRFSRAHLRVAHDAEGDDDAQPSRFTMDLDVGTARGPGFIGPYGYGGAYPGIDGGRDGIGHGDFDAFRADESRDRDADLRVRGRR